MRTAASQSEIRPVGRRPGEKKPLAGPLLFAVIAIGAGAAYAEERRRKRRLKQAKRVRDAGPDNMRSPPRRWDPHDQALDESFPASDPPGTY
jgi:hypothetical protein